MSRSALSLPPFRNLQRLAMLRTGCSVDRESLIWLRMLSCQMRTESSISREPPAIFALGGAGKSPGRLYPTPMFAHRNPSSGGSPETLREVDFVDCLGEGFLVLDGSSLDQIRQ